MTTPARTAFDEALEFDRQGDSGSALNAYLTALELAPDDMEIAYRAATALLRAGHLEEAASQLRRVVFVEPDNTAARANLGNCQFLLGDHANAETNFIEVLAASPDNRNALYGLATVRMEQGKRAAALDPAQRLLALMPDSAPALTLYGQIISTDAQTSNAVASLRKAVNIDPTYQPALISLAELCIRRKRFDEALDLARRAHELQPSAGAPLRIMSDALQHQGAFEEAHDALMKAIEVDPGHRLETLVRLSTVCRKMGNGIDALLHARQAVRVSPQNPEAGNALGSALAALGQMLVARAVLTNIARKTPMDDALLDRVDEACLAAEQQKALQTAAELSAAAEQLKKGIEPAKPPFSSAHEEVHPEEASYETEVPEDSQDPAPAKAASPAPAPEPQEQGLFQHEASPEEMEQIDMFASPGDRSAG
ncbi:tetratricopeptide repeat protein [Roseibium suaedae]|uniref:Tfp pilus assembly protein PilF n=1 Tax=Roseibium suaedae TaxID=735517 RepID=A0A1M7KID7_9HYPH|nr:tetratricopeptide repeat protein [Roseibium suaedae]SHM65105.1 Tfp pilus assembly protein PilF [Roseibium suaedae]